jgi:type VI secretion system secreted protein VgrG
MDALTNLIHDQVPPEAVVNELTVFEGLSHLFDVQVQFVCSDPDLDLDAFIWSEGAVRLSRESEGELQRVFHGVVEEAEFVGRKEGLFCYRLRFRPRIHGLKYRLRTRIFQEKSAVDIAEAVLRGAGIATEAFERKGLTVKREPREYCTQWRESELDFVLRLLEEEGIFYWFEHTESSHVMKVGDAPSVHAPIAGAKAIPLSSWHGRDGGRESIRNLTFTARTVPDACAMRDWNWQAPKSPCEGAQIEGKGGFESYFFPGGFAQANVGQSRARDWLLASRSRRLELRGVTNSWRLEPGRLFELTDAQPEALCGEYLLLEVRHRYRNDGFVAGSSGATHYEAEFTAIPSATQFKPPRTILRPRVYGKESAVITGPPGEEIHVDSFGRVKVHFYWDREGKVDDHASCWIRVQQQNTSGGMILPRVGWEVDVGFLYGDPDRPVVLHKLYNAENMPPYRLPDALMQSSLQSSSTPGGGGTNEIRMNDSNGGMEFFIHSQKDLDVSAGNNLVEDIAVDALTQIGADCTTKVDGTEEIAVGANQSMSVKGSAAHETAGAKTVNIGALDDWGVGGMHAINVKGARTEKIGALQNVLAVKVTETFNADHTRTAGVLSFNSAAALVEAVAGKKIENVGGMKMEVIGKSKAEQVEIGKILTAGAVNLKTGQDLSVAAEAAMAINSGGPMVIKCDKDFTISGATVTITVGSAKLEAGGKLSLSPGSAKIEGDSVGGNGGDVLLKGEIKYRG